MDTIFSIVSIASAIVGLISFFMLKGKPSKIIGVAALVVSTIFVGINKMIDGPAASNQIVETETVQSETMQPTVYGDSYSNAKAMSIDTPFKARFDINQSKREEHWYYFDANEDMFFNIDLSGSKDMLLEICLYDASGKKELVSEEGSDKIISLSYPLQKGRFYIKITSNISGIYDVAPSKAISGYLNEESDEGNDTYQTPSSITLNQAQNGHIGYCSDSGIIDETDYFRFDLQTPTIINASLVADNPLDINMSLLCKDGDKVITHDNGRNKMLNFEQALQEGTYYMRLSKLDGYGGYNLSVKTSTPNNASDEEPNNSYQEAKRLATPTYGQIGFVDQTNTRDTEDWYLIHVASTSLTISLKPISATSSIRAALMDYTASDTIKSAGASDEIVTYQVEELSPGDYYIRVYGDGNGYGCYELSVQ